AVRWAGLAAGVELPRPTVVPLQDALPIAHWMAGVLRNGQTPCLVGYVSPIERLCQAAFEAGIELHGARFYAGGEPMTAARRAAILRVGADVATGYQTTEAGAMGRSCGVPQMPDDIHIYRDRCALSPPGE